MDQELDYAEMLEIPVSTVSVVKKKPIFKKYLKKKEDLKDVVVDAVNERVSLENERVGSKNERTDAKNEDDGTTETVLEDFAPSFVQTEDISDMPVKKRKRKADVGSIVLIAETVTACLIAGGIFLTNVFMPNSAINTFMGNLTAIREKQASFSDFTLTSPVSSLSNASVNVSDEGVLSFTERTSVYPVCGGSVATISQKDGTYTVSIAHSPTFTSVVTGLDIVYVTVGDNVAANVPFAYSNGEKEVKVSLYDGDTKLNCYTVSGAIPVWNS